MTDQKIKVALAHDYLVKNGGAEKVLESLHDLFPRAPVYTLVYDQLGTDNRYASWDIRTSSLQRKPFIHKAFNYYRALMPRAVESFDLSEYDLVISDSSSFIKGVMTQPSTVHVCYMHSPTRFLWFDVAHHISRGKFIGVAKQLIPYVLHRLRQWDFLAAQRPDFIVANSHTTESRITKFYRRNSIVIYPPVDIERFDHTKRDPKDFFVIVGRLEPHKETALAIEACTKARQKLYVIGAGSDERKLKQLAGPQVHFLGHVRDENVLQYLYGAKAVLSPQIEDFGITTVEALAAGCPVIGRNEGGTAEIVENGKSGILINELTAVKLAQVLQDFDPLDFSPATCNQSARRYTKHTFGASLSQYIEQLMREQSKGTVWN